MVFMNSILMTKASHRMRKMGQRLILDQRAKKSGTTLMTMVQIVSVLRVLYDDGGE